MTKKILRILCVFLVSVLLYSCMNFNAKRIVGTWEGDGSFSFREGMPISGVTRLVFREDETGTAYAEEGEIPFTYALTDDTLTIRPSKDFGLGITYSISSDTLTLRRECVFTRAD